MPKHQRISCMHANISRGYYPQSSAACMQPSTFPSINIQHIELYAGQYLPRVLSPVVCRLHTAITMPQHQHQRISCMHANISRGYYPQSSAACMQQQTSCAHSSTSSHTSSTFYSHRPSSCRRGKTHKAQAGYKYGPIFRISNSFALHGFRFFVSKIHQPKTLH